MPEKKGLFARLFSGLSKTRGNLTEKVDEITREDRKIDEDFYEMAPASMAMLQMVSRS